MTKQAKDKEHSNRSVPSRLNRSRLTASPRLEAFPIAPIALAAALALMSGPAHALPLGAEVEAGQANVVHTSPNRLDVIQTTPHAVLNWNSFSIGSGEHVHFQQPSAQAAVLNRVTGPEASSILGRVTGNGSVYLLNPNGVVIGPGATIDTGSFVATASNISTANFMSGQYRFESALNKAARIVNHGEINVAQGGLVALVGPGVENSGIIRATLGKVALASGDSFTLDLFGDKLINLAVDDAMLRTLADKHGLPQSSQVDNTGVIQADGGKITITAANAKSVLDRVVNVAGVVQARSFAQRDGVIELLGSPGVRVAIAGTLDVTGKDPHSTGGRITATAQQVEVGRAATIDASGQAGGGIVLLGGDFKGGGSLPRAMQTTIHAGATIAANSIATGPAGRVIVWSDGDTRFDGHISAAARGSSGDGGFIEVSGKNNLAFRGGVDLGTVAGRPGQLLLDPLDLIVTSDVSASTGGLSLADTSVSAAEFPGQIVTIFDQQVEALLQRGVSVVLEAQRDLSIRSTIDGRASDGTPGGSLSLTAGRDVAISDSIFLNNGNLAISAVGAIRGVAGTALSTGTGDVSMSTSGAQGAIAVGYIASSGSVTVSATTDLSVLNTITGGPGDSEVPISATTVHLSAGGAGAVAGVRAGSGGVTIDVKGALDIGVEIPSTSGPKPVAIESNGPVSVISGGSTTIRNAVISQGGITLTSKAGNLNIDADLRTPSALNASAPNGGFVQKAGTVLDAGRSGTVGIITEDSIALQDIVAGGTISVESKGGSVYFNKALGGNLTGYERGIDFGLDTANGPTVGLISAKAHQDIYINGLNLAGSAPSPSGAYPAALTVAAGRRVVINDRIAVNAGDITIGASTAETAQIWLGDSIFSRGVYRGPGHPVTGFNITLHNDLVLFDNGINQESVIHTVDTVSSVYRKVVVSNNPRNFGGEDPSGDNSPTLQGLAPNDSADAGTASPRITVGAKTLQTLFNGDTRFLGKAPQEIPPGSLTPQSSLIVAPDKTLVLKLVSFAGASDSNSELSDPPDTGGQLGNAENISTSRFGSRVYLPSQVDANDFELQWLKIFQQTSINSTSSRVGFFVTETYRWNDGRNEWIQTRRIDPSVFEGAIQVIDDGQAAYGRRYVNIDHLLSLDRRDPSWPTHLPIDAHFYLLEELRTPPSEVPYGDPFVTRLLPIRALDAEGRLLAYESDPWNPQAWDDHRAVQTAFESIRVPTEESYFPPIADAATVTGSVTRTHNGVQQRTEVAIAPYLDFLGKGINAVIDANGLVTLNPGRDTSSQLGVSGFSGVPFSNVGASSFDSLATLIPPAKGSMLSVRESVLPVRAGGVPQSPLEALAFRTPQSAGPSLVVGRSVATFADLGRTASVSGSTADIFSLNGGVAGVFRPSAGEQNRADILSAPYFSKSPFSYLRSGD